MVMRTDWKRVWEDWRRRVAEQEGRWNDYEWVWGMMEEMEDFEVELRWWVKWLERAMGWYNGR